jgi:L-asparaginase II
MKSTEYLPVFEATRGELVESIHLGAFAVVDSLGDLVASWGDPDSITFLRSSAKPFQALPFIENGGDVYFGLNGEEIAAFCASHSGTDDHVRIINGLQQKMGLEESMLQCGTHIPTNSETWVDMIKRGEKPTPIRHMCSGKHTGMLGYGRLIGADLTSYLSMDNPIQKNILKTFSEMTAYPVDKIVVGIDGCSAPNFAVPLRNAAYAFARLCQPAGISDARTSACQRISAAMRDHPNMIAGPRKFDTMIMGQTNPKVVSKAGAEGYQCLGVMPNAIEPGSPALGIALKIADGDAEDRARPLVSIEILRQLGAITGSEAESLQKFGPRRIFNAAKLGVGEFRPAFSIK